MVQFITLATLFLIYHFIDYAFSKANKVKREMDDIDKLINDALGNKRTRTNRKKNNS